MNKLLSLCILCASCAGLDASRSADLLDAPDLLGPAADADTTATTDLQPAAADLLQARPADLARAADLSPVSACGGTGQPCCAGDTCDTIPWSGGSAQLFCFFTGDVCTAVRPSVCVLPMNCGYGGLPCCDSSGNPSSIGYCKTGDRCTNSKCLACP